MSPSLVVAIVALVLAVDDTAVAAEQIVTRPDKVATGVIEARHIAPNCASATPDSIARCCACGWPTKARARRRPGIARRPECPRRYSIAVPAGVAARRL
jgi:hypothetical protein